MGLEHNEKGIRTKNNKLVSDRVVELQELQRKSDEEMASSLRVTKPHYSRKLKKGKASFTQDTLAAMAEMGFDVNYILIGRSFIGCPEFATSSVLEMKHGILSVVKDLPKERRRELLIELIKALLSAVK